MASGLTDIAVRTITGETSSLAAYAGKVKLVVNVASKCGLTPQYTALEALHQRYKDRGLAVLAFPANDFLGQEPGTETEIREFCSTTYDVTFPLFAKIKVVGPDKHPLYAALIAAHPARASKGSGFVEMLRSHGISPNPEPEVLWNFEKFLVDGDGAVIGRFSPDIAPDDPLITEAIEKAL
jgi:glutathione peroxidase